MYISLFISWVENVKTSKNVLLLVSRFKLNKIFFDRFYILFGWMNKFVFYWIKKKCDMSHASKKNHFDNTYIASFYVT